MSRQTNFTGGELAPLFQGRTDLPVYARALKKMRNFFASHHGAAVSRPGTLFVNAAKNPNDTEARLIPFIFSDEQSYALEFGEGYIRFHTNGGTVENLPGTGGYFQKTTQYQTAHLRGIKYSQVGDVLTLTRNGYAAMELRRLPDWTLAGLQLLQTRAEAEALFASAQSSLNTGGNPDPVVVKAAFRRIFITQDEAAAEAIALAFGEVSFTAWMGAHPLDIPGGLVAFQTAYYNAFEAALWDGAQGAPHWTFLPAQFTRAAPFFAGTAGSYPCIDSNHLPAEDATHPDRVWMYAVTQTVKDRETGRQFETLPYFVVDSWDHNPANRPVALADNLHSVYPDAHLILYRGQHLDRAGTDPQAVDQSFQELGWNIYKGHDRRVMGLIGTAEGDTFVDVGIEPDYATQPPMGTNPFLTYDYAGNLAEVETPAACCIFQDRRWFGGTQLRPITLFGSATGDYPNFDLHQLVHSAGESVLFDLAALQGEKLVHLVPGRQMLVGTRSNWRYLRGAGGPVDYDSIDTNIIDNVGTRDVVPLVLDDELLFVRTKGSGVRALKTDQGENLRGYDCSTHADHLLRGKGDYFPSLGFKKTLIDWTYAEDPWGLIWAVREDGMLLSATYLGEGKAGFAWHDSYTANGAPGIFKSVCAVPEGDEDAVYVLVRRALAVAAPTASPSLLVPAPSGFVLCVERMTSRVRNGDAEDDACVDCGLRFEGLPTTTITDLDHLIGEQVWFVATGNPPMGPLLVSAAGEIELPDMPIANDDANVVGFIGLRYVPELETLDVAAGSAKGKMAAKAVAQVGLELEQSSGILVGRTFQTSDADMLETQPHTVATGYGQPEPETELVTSELDNSWETGGRICIRQSKPLPVTVKAILRDLSVGG